MHINHELAEQIRAKAQTILGRKVIVADSSGQILTGDSPSGLSADALKASQSGNEVIGSSGGAGIHWSPFVYEQETVGVLGVVVERGNVTKEAISLLQGLAEVIVHQYMLIDRIHSTEVMKSSFITSALTSAQINPDEIHRQADILGLNLRSNQAVMLFDLEGFEAEHLANLAHLSREEQRLEIIKATEAIDQLVKSSFDNYQDNIVAYSGSDRFILLKGIGGDNLNTLNTVRFLKKRATYLAETLAKIHTRSPITIGVGQYYPDLGGLRKSYQDAKLALGVGTKVWGSGRVYHIKDVGMYITLANTTTERKAELAHQILNPLMRDTQLFTTVQTFLANNLNLTDAATKLHIHRNTLIYRLDKTKKLIALDPRHFDDALQIKLGLMFQQAG